MTFASITSGMASTATVGRVRELEAIEADLNDQKEWLKNQLTFIAFRDGKPVVSEELVEVLHYYDRPLVTQHEFNYANHASLDSVRVRLRFEGKRDLIDGDDACHVIYRVSLVHEEQAEGCPGDLKFLLPEGDDAILECDHCGLEERDTSGIRTARKCDPLMRR